MLMAINPFQAELQREFDDHIGRLDRILSEFLLWPKQTALDEANRQTLKHHADDLIGVGQKMHELLNPKTSDTPFTDHIKESIAKDKK